MIHALIGFLSGTFCLFVYFLFHRTRSIPRQHLLYFFLLCIFGAVILQSYENMFTWLGFLGLSYVALEDYSKRTIPIVLPVWIALYTFFFDGKLDTLLWPFIFFILFVVIDVLWDKWVTTKTDLLFLFPLLYLSFFEHDVWIAYVVFLAMTLLARLSKERFIGEGDAYVALPLLFLLEPTWFLSFFLFSLVLALPFAYHHAHTKHQEDFAFSPYLLGGFLLVFSNNPYFSLVALALSFISLLIMWVLFRLKK